MLNAAIAPLLVAVGGLGPVATAGCAERDAARLTIFSASSLTEAITDIAAEFERTGHPRPITSFGATSRLARQLAKGAPADVFLAVDERWISVAFAGSATGVAPLSVAVPIATNKLVAVAWQGRARVWDSTAQWRADPPRRLAMASAEVPAGHHADGWLAVAGLRDALLRHVVRARNVRAAAGLVAAGHADAGIVYASDTVSVPGLRVVEQLDRPDSPPIRVLAAIQPACDTSSTTRCRDARAFVQFLVGDAARAVFRRRGFSPVDQR